MDDAPMLLSRCFEIPGGGGWVYLYSFICLSAGAVECFATTLLHHAPPKVTSVLVLFVTFEGLFYLIGI